MLKISIATQWLRHTSQYFVNPLKIHNAEAQYRAQVLAGCIIVFSAISLLAALILLPQWLQGKIGVIGCYMALFIALFFFGCLYVLKKTGNNIITANLAATPLYLSLVYSGLIIGGPAATSNTIMLLIPLIVYFTAGARSAIYWTGIIFFTLITFFVMHKLGYVFIKSISAESIIDQGFLHWGITLVGILGTARVYEKTYYNLITQRDKRETDNKFLSTHDLLTGTMNRQYLITALNQYIKTIKKNNLTLTFMLIDAHHFYTINDKFGLAAGDQVLTKLATRLSSFPKIKMVARTNGNQFAIISHSHERNEDSSDLIEDILQIATEPYTIEHRIISLPIHIGLSFLSDEKNDAEALLHQAETSLKKAKCSNFTYLNE